jgi:hypothetical protein
LYFNESDNLEPYLYFLDPERGSNFASVVADEFVQGLAGSGDRQAEWTLIYGRPGERPESLSAGGGGSQVEVQILAEFNQDRFLERFPPVVRPGHADLAERYHFGPPITVYRLRRVPRPAGVISGAEGEEAEGAPEDRH